MGTGTVKKLSLRIPPHLWGPISHRLVDEMISWQSLLIPVLERYAAGEDIHAPAAPAGPDAPRRPFADELGDWIVRGSNAVEREALLRALQRAALQPK